MTPKSELPKLVFPHTGAMEHLKLYHLYLYLVLVVDAPCTQYITVHHSDANDLPRQLWSKVVPITFQIILDAHNCMVLCWKGMFCAERDKPW